MRGREQPGTLISRAHPFCGRVLSRCGQSGLFPRDPTEAAAAGGAHQERRLSGTRQSSVFRAQRFLPALHLVCFPGPLSALGPPGERWEKAPPCSSI